MTISNDLRPYFEKLYSIIRVYIQLKFPMLSSIRTLQILGDENIKLQTVTVEKESELSQ